MYNLAIIGGGPAGYVAAEKAIKAGMSVVIFERDSLGGTCLNVGCIPTKTLLYSAKQYYNATHGLKYGLSAEGVAYDYAKMVQRKTKVVRKLVAGIKQKLHSELCTVVPAEAQVLRHSDTEVVLLANGEEYTADRLLICTGSVNFVPPIPGVEGNDHIWDSTQALAASELPQSVCIVGGGVIGMEFATLYHELGVPVTVVEAMDRILPNLDEEVVTYLSDKYRKAGVDIRTACRVESIEGGVVHTTEGDIEADRILLSVGRRARMNGLEALGLETYRGGIVVDEGMRTSLPNVWAAGDVTGKLMLAHVASRQAEVAVAHMLDADSEACVNYRAIPSVVYTNPEIASVGLTEAEAQGNQYEVRRMPMAFSGRFVAENEGENGLCKMIIDRTANRVVGVHMVGNPCSEIISTTAMMIDLGIAPDRLHEVVMPHPTVAEILHESL